MKEVNIAGSGIAGMSAAIYLSSKGIPVTIQERKSRPGQSRHGDYEGLENWIFDENISSFFYKIGFDYSKIKSHPVYKFKVHVLNEEPLLVKNKEPFFYLVKRGEKNNDF